MGGGREWVWLKERCVGAKAGGVRAGMPLSSHLQGENWTPGRVLLEAGGREAPPPAQFAKNSNPLRKGLGRNPKG